MSRWDMIFDASLCGFAAVSVLNLVLKLFGVYDYLLVLSVILPSILFVGMIVSAIGLARQRRTILGSGKSSLIRMAALWVLIGSMLANAAITPLTFAQPQSATSGDH